MVDKSSEISFPSSVHDGVGVRPEQVTAADPHLLVLGLSKVCDALTNHLSHVLDQHGVWDCLYEHGRTKEHKRKRKAAGKEVSESMRLLTWSLFDVVVVFVVVCCC